MRTGRRHPFPPTITKAMLAKFATTAKFRDSICAYAQVDKLGTNSATGGAIPVSGLHWAAVLFGCQALTGRADIGPDRFDDGVE